jgi:uncharacterized protein (TIGR02246 family)
MVALVAPASAIAQSEADRAEIRRVAMRQAETWNRHDAKAYMALFTEDCDVVNVLGWHWKGREEAEQKLSQAFRFVFRDSRLTITDVDTRFIRPDVAIAHVPWTMTGARTPPGMPQPRQGIQTIVFIRQQRSWRIAALHNTNSIPERPFPASPAEAGEKSH